jgi:hypothetical protein
VSDTGMYWRYLCSLPQYEDIHFSILASPVLSRNILVDTEDSSVSCCATQVSLFLDNSGRSIDYQYCRYYRESAN